MIIHEQTNLDEEIENLRKILAQKNHEKDILSDRIKKLKSSFEAGAVNHLDGYSVKRDHIMAALDTRCLVANSLTSFNDHAVDLVNYLKEWIDKKRDIFMNSIILQIKEYELIAMKSDNAPALSVLLKQNLYISVCDDIQSIFISCFNTRQIIKTKETLENIVDVKNQMIKFYLNYGSILLLASDLFKVAYVDIFNTRVECLGNTFKHGSDIIVKICHEQDWINSMVISHMKLKMTSMIIPIIMPSSIMLFGGFPSKTIEGSPPKIIQGSPPRTFLQYSNINIVNSVSHLTSETNWIPFNQLIEESIILPITTILKSLSTFIKEIRSIPEIIGYQLRALALNHLFISRSYVLKIIPLVSWSELMCSIIESQDESQHESQDLFTGALKTLLFKICGVKYNTFKFEPLKPLKLLIEQLPEIISTDVLLQRIDIVIQNILLSFNTTDVTQVPLYFNYVSKYEFSESEKQFPCGPNFDRFQSAFLYPFHCAPEDILINIKRIVTLPNSLSVILDYRQYPTEDLYSVPNFITFAEANFDQTSEKNRMENLNNTTKRDHLEKLRLLTRDQMLIAPAFFFTFEDIMDQLFAAYIKLSRISMKLNEIKGSNIGFDMNKWVVDAINIHITGKTFKLYLNPLMFCTSLGLYPNFQSNTTISYPRLGSVISLIQYQATDGSILSNDLYNFGLMLAIVMEYSSSYKHHRLGDYFVRKAASSITSDIQTQFMTFTHISDYARIFFTIAFESNLEKRLDMFRTFLTLSEEPFVDPKARQYVKFVEGCSNKVKFTDDFHRLWNTCIMNLPYAQALPMELDVINYVENNEVVHEYSRAINTMMVLIEVDIGRIHELLNPVAKYKTILAFITQRYRLSYIIREKKERFNPVTEDTQKVSPMGDGPEREFWVGFYNQLFGSFVDDRKEECTMFEKYGDHYIPKRNVHTDKLNDYFLIGVLCGKDIMLGFTQKQYDIDIRGFFPKAFLRYIITTGENVEFKLEDLIDYDESVAKIMIDTFFMDQNDFRDITSEDITDLSGLIKYGLKLQTIPLSWQYFKRGIQIIIDFFFKSEKPTPNANYDKVIQYICQEMSILKPLTIEHVLRHSTINVYNHNVPSLEHTQCVSPQSNVCTKADKPCIGTLVKAYVKNCNPSQLSRLAWWATSRRRPSSIVWVFREFDNPDVLPTVRTCFNQIVLRKLSMVGKFETILENFTKQMDIAIRNTFYDKDDQDDQQ